MAKTKKNFKRILGFLAIVVLVVLVLMFFMSWWSLSYVNAPTDWRVYVKSGVINTLNSEYDPNIEKMYCVDGTIDDVNKKVTISTITSIELAYAQKNEAASLELYPCKGKLGMIHTHPKYLGFISECGFSDLDLLGLGTLYGRNNVFLGGVYCTKDKMSFYLVGSDILGNLFSDNSRIGYTKIE